MSSSADVLSAFAGQRGARARAIRLYSGFLEARRGVTKLSRGKFPPDSPVAPESWVTELEQDLQDCSSS